jgi:hypothetical protein
VGSVGKVELPFATRDDEVLSKEYMDLIKGVTRAEVDKEITRCPHRETSAKMEEVGLTRGGSCPIFAISAPVRRLTVGDPSGKGEKRLDGRYSHLCDPKLPRRSRRAGL